MTDDAESLTRDEKAWLKALLTKLETSKMEYDSEPQRVIREEEPLSKEERLRRDLKAWLEVLANLETSEMEYDSEPQRVIREEEPLSKEERLRRDLEDRIYHSLEKGDGEGVKESLAVYGDFCQVHEIPFEIEFNTRDLSGMDLSGLSLPRVRFSKCLLEGVSFKETNLERAVFVQCEFGPNEFARVQSTTDTDVVWESANLTEACFLDCSDLDSSLSGAIIHNTEIDRRILLSAGIYDTEIELEMKREEEILLKEEAEIMMMDEY